MIGQSRLVPIDSIHLHPSAGDIPKMRPDEWDDFYNDVAMHDIKVPIEITADGTILDGRHRFEAAQKMGKTMVPVTDAPLSSGEDGYMYMVKAAVLRRHLTDDQRATMSVLWKQEHKVPDGVRNSIPLRGGTENKKPNTVTKAVTEFKTTRKKHDQATKLYNQTPELFTKAHEGEITLRDAVTLSELNTEDQHTALDMVKTHEVKNVHLARRKIMKDKAEDFKPPEGSYQVIYADPPWEYDFGFDIHGAAQRHYNTMNQEELCGYPVPADKNSILFMWVTAPKIPEAVDLIRAWGFDYKTCFIWDKVDHVMGHYSSVRHELLFVAGKGSFPKQSDTLRDSVITIPRSSIHSRKPGEFRDLIDEMYPHATKIELFVGEDNLERAGWVFSGGKTL